MATINSTESALLEEPALKKSAAPPELLLKALKARQAGAMKPDSEVRPAQNLFRVLWRWHFYAGVLIAPFLIILSVTGGLYIFKSEIEGFARSDLMYVTSGSTTLGYQAQVDAAAAAYPGFKASQVEIRPDADRATVVTLRQPAPPREPGQAPQAGRRGPRAPSVNAFVDPYTGTVLGGIRSDEDQLAGFFSFTLNLHRRLFIGTTGRVITELATGWTIILIGTGVYLWWPKNRTKIRGVWVPRWTSRGYTFLRDMHTVFGMYLMPIALTIAVTGMFYTFAVGKVIHDVAHHVMEDEETPAVAKGQSPESSSSEKSGRERSRGERGTKAKEAAALNENKMTESKTAEEKPKKEEPTEAKPTEAELPLDDAIAVLKREYPDRIFFATIGRPMFGRGGGAATNEPKGMRVSAGTDFNASYGPIYSTNMILKHDTGEVVSRKHLSEGGHFWHAWTYPLHVGSVFGVWTKILWFLACIVLTGLPITGVWMWWRRRPTGTMGLPRKPNRVIPWWMYAGIITLCVFMPIVGASVLLIFVGERMYEFVQRRRQVSAAV